MTRVVIQKLASEGIAKNSRTPSITKAAYVQNFDVLTYPNSLKPYPGMVANETKAYFITDFQYVVGGVGVSTNILGFGVVSGQSTGGHAELYMKTGDVVTGGWTTVLASPGGAVKNRSANLFFLYKGYIYYGSAGTHISRIGDLEVSGTGATLSETYFAVGGVGFTNLTQAIRHSKDDIMYFGLDNKVYYKNGTAGTISLGVTLPSDLIVTSLVEYGNYIMIACKPSDGVNESVSFLWDRDTSLNTVTESIPWGTGLLKIIGTVDGVPIGISIIGTNSFDVVSPRIVIKKYVGGEPQIVHELISENSVIDLTQKKWQTNNRLFFGAKITLNGALRHCMFVVGKDENGEIIVVPDVNVNNDTALTGNIDGFAKFGGVWYIAYNTDGSVNRTITDGSYSGTSIYESLKTPSMPIADRHLPKQISAISASYSKLPGVGQTLVSYRVDGSTTWETIQTDAVDNSVFMEATAEDDGTPFAEGREPEFRLESTGGAEITEFSYRYKVKSSQIDG